MSLSASDGADGDEEPISPASDLIVDVDLHEGEDALHGNGAMKDGMAIRGDLTPTVGGFEVR